MKKTQKTKCGVCTPEHYERNNYFYQKSFTVRDMFAEQSYFNQKRYLINRMVLGWGVVCGLDVCVPGGLQLFGRRAGFGAGLLRARNPGL